MRTRVSPQESVAAPREGDGVAGDPAMAPAATVGLDPVDAPALVLDTNAVLDWLWFADRSMHGVARAIVAGRCRWLQTGAMRAELEHVLRHRLPPRPGGDAGAVVTACRRWAHAVAEAAPALLRCADRDDQMFVDLAIAAGARWLVTRDRALLALARRAQALGLAVIEPPHWPRSTSPRAA